MQSKLYSYMHSKTVQVPVELPGIEAATDTTTQKDTWRETNKARGPERRTRPVTQGRTPLKKELRTPTVNCLGKKLNFFARGTTTKTTIFCTKESTKKHDLEHDVWTKREQCTKESTKKHDFWHEGEHQKARYRAGFWHEGEHQKARFLCTRESTKKHDFCARGRAPKSTILVHKGEHQKARSRARFFCTRESTEKHDFVHEGKHSKQRSPKIRPHRRCWGVIFRMALVKGYRFTWVGGGSHFSAKTSCFW